MEIITVQDLINVLQTLNPSDEIVCEYDSSIEYIYSVQKEGPVVVIRHDKDVTYDTYKLWQKWEEENYESVIPPTLIDDELEET